MVQHPLAAHRAEFQASPELQRLLRNTVVGLIAFLTLVDLFATQAILPSLAARYQVKPAAIGFAVNASTIGMALSCLCVALVGHHLNRRTGIWVSLALLSIPTAMLAWAPDLTIFTALRIVQGIFMASAFTLSMAYLAEHLNAEDTARALAAYITGVVASNLVGRLTAASVTGMYGLEANFWFFAGLNLAGAALVYFYLDRMRMIGSTMTPKSPLAAWAEHLRNPALGAAFLIGFLILFAFIGIFTYVNFVLSGPRLGLSQMSLGLVYFVFLPAIFTTPLAGRTAVRLGTTPTLVGALLVAAAGLPLLLLGDLRAVILGLALVGIGTFFAQAVTTGFVGRTATSERAAASGLYLASYYLGGLVGALALGRIFDAYGWATCVAVVAASLALAALLATRLHAAPLPEPAA